MKTMYLLGLAAQISEIRAVVNGQSITEIAKESSQRSRADINRRYSVDSLSRASDVSMTTVRSGSCCDMRSSGTGIMGWETAVNSACILHELMPSRGGIVIVTQGKCRSFCDHHIILRWNGCTARAACDADYSHSR